MAYSYVEPFGERRADIRAGTIAAMIFNRQRSEKESPLQAADFFPDFLPAEKPKAKPEEKPITGPELAKLWRDQGMKLAAVPDKDNG